MEIIVHNINGLAPKARELLRERALRQQRIEVGTDVLETFEFGPQVGTACE